MRTARKDLRQGIASLETMSLADLRAEWGRRYGAPPRHRSRDLLRRVLAWRMQADVLGGFDAVTRRLLESDRDTVRIAAPSGTRLAREYNGRRHEVLVKEDGSVLYEQQTFGSLSEVARHITGQRWNGPRFFGLRGQNRR